ncbi:MAG TPA: hypothetical protein PK725_16655 [Rhodocyclaceae bacterium]|nr:hypothetical protein [Rhodocyclaceae bacterium]
MRTWIVKVLPVSPAYDDRGVELQIEAPLKRIAIAKARRVIKRSLTYDRLDGPLRFLATEIIDSPQPPTRVNPFALDNPSEATAPQKALPPHIGKLCRNGAPVYYTFPPHAAYREASDWHDLV